MAKHGQSATGLVHEHHRYGSIYCDLELNEALDQMFAAGMIGFPDPDYAPRVSDYDFYNMVRYIRPHNFPVLAMMGIRTGRDATNLFYDLGVANLLVNDQPLVEAAQKLKITPGEYLDILNVAGEYASNDDVIRAFRLQVKLRDASGVIPSIVLGTLDGTIRYEHAEAIGFEKFLSKSGLAHIALADTARQLKWNLSKNSYTVDDIKAVYSAKPDTSKSVRITKSLSDTNEVPFEKVVDLSRSARLIIMRTVGSAEAALKVQHPVLIQQMMDGKRYSDILKDDATILYMDRLIEALGDDLMSIPKQSEVELYAKENVDPEMVARERAIGSDAQRIMALHNGSHTAMTDGWL